MDERCKRTNDSRKSSSWIHFEKINKDNSMCKICKKTLKTCGNTTNMMKHLLTAHAIDLKSDMRSTPPVPVPKRRPNCRTLMSSKEKEMEIREDDPLGNFTKETKLVVNQPQLTELPPLFRIGTELNDAPTNVKTETLRDELFDQNEEPFDYVGDLTRTQYNGNNDNHTSDTLRTTEDILSKLNKTLESHLNAFKSVTMQLNDMSSKNSKRSPFYDYIDTLLNKLPDKKVDELSKNFLLSILKAIEDRECLES